MYAARKVNVIKTIPKGKLNYSICFSLLMVLPDVFKRRTQIFFPFSLGKEERRLGSNLQTFRRREKQDDRKGLPGIPMWPIKLKTRD